MRRQIINFKWVALTDLKVKVSRNARQKTLTKAWTEAGVQAKWEASGWAKKLAAKTAKAGQTDLDRFKAKLSQQKVRAAVRKQLKA